MQGLNEMKRKFFLLASYFTVTPLLLLFIMFYTLYIIHDADPHTKKNFTLFTPGVTYKALPQDVKGISLQAESVDARESALKEFFKRYSSPLEDHAKEVVLAADKYGIDYRLLPAIAMQESGLCKKIPKDSYNCWGFGIYGKKVTRFENYPQAINTVSKTLATEYIAKGYDNPEKIMQKYTPSSNGSWAESVVFFMEKIEASL